MSKKEEKKSRLKTAPKSDGRGGKFLAYYPFNDQWFFYQQRPLKHPQG